MSRSPVFAWILLCVWALWLQAVQALLVGVLGPWTPDLGLVLLATLSARLSTQLLPWTALATALARSALTLDPLAAVLAAHLFAVGALRLLRIVVELRTPLVFAPVVLLVTVATSLGLDVVREARLALEPGLPPGAFQSALATGLSTAIVALVSGPLLTYLPGLSPLRRSSPWSRVASAR